MEDEFDPRDQTEDSEFDERYYTTKAVLLQLIEKFKPCSAGPSASGAGGLTNDTAMIQILEQQATLIQRLTECNDALARIVE